VVTARLFSQTLMFADEVYSPSQIWRDIPCDISRHYETCWGAPWNSMYL